MRNLKTTFFVLFCLIQSFSFSQTKDLTSFVNPFIGTGGHGHTYPGVSLPFGMVQLSPDTRLTGWDGCSGYHYSDSIIYGFSHTHLSGTGCSDYGDVLLMPMVDKYSFKNTEYASGFSHKNESASPGYYKVIMKNGVIVELTASQRTGFHKYSYPAYKTPYVVLDLAHRDEVIESSLEIVNDTTVKGLRRSKAWASDQYVYFVMVFSKPIRSYGIASNDSLKKDLKKASGKNLKAYFAFDKSWPNTVLVKVGISAVSTDGAYANLHAEIRGWNFDGQIDKAKTEWNKELGKIEVEGGTKDQKITFYTALYHSFLTPNLYMDTDEQYRGTDLKIHKAAGFDNYTVFSLWDTYRAAHPLYTLIQQKRTGNFINTFLNEYKNGGLLPVWELSGNETFCMIGYHSVSVIADAYMKGIKGYDSLGIFKAMKSSAEADRYGLSFYKKYGHIPGDKEGESVSKTLEYAYDDWCIAQMAKKLGKADDYKTYIQRAQSYKNVFDPETGFMRAKINGGWLKPFDPTEVNFNYTEANCWQYNFNVPQDISTYMEMLGGREYFSDKLDTMFYGKYKLSGRTQDDITGLIGQYAHGNEPSHHMAYLYDYAGKAWKTQEVVHKIESEMYSNKTDGLIGNEDCGQMSAWYVMSAMGIYQVCPCNEQYAIGTPVFKKVTLHLENGRNFVISAQNVSSRNFYIKSATLNGEPCTRSYIRHNEIMNGGTLSFTMDSIANKLWADDSILCPKTLISDFPIVTVPYLIADSKTFTKSLKVDLKAANDEQIYYTLDGSDPLTKGDLYKGPLTIKKTSHLKFYSLDKTAKSCVIDADFYKIPEGRSIKITSKCDDQYTAGGSQSLIDGLRGTTDFRLGSWQGYQGQNFEAVVDLGSNQSIKKIAAGFLQDIGSWIWMPTQVEYSVSPDGVDWTDVGMIKNTVSEKDYTPTIKDFTATVDNKCRYVRVKAKYYGVIPSWHLGAGGQSYIFIDEIVIE